MLDHCNIQTRQSTHLDIISNSSEAPCHVVKFVTDTWRIHKEEYCRIWATALRMAYESFHFAIGRLEINDVLKHALLSLYFIKYVIQLVRNSWIKILLYLCVRILCRLNVMMKQTEGGGLMSRMSARAIGLGAQRVLKSNLSISR